MQKESFEKGEERALLHIAVQVWDRGAGWGRVLEGFFGVVETLKMVEKRLESGEAAIIGEFCR